MIFFVGKVFGFSTSFGNNPFKRLAPFEKVSQVQTLHKLRDAECISCISCISCILLQADVFLGAVPVKFVLWMIQYDSSN